MAARLVQHQVADIVEVVDAILQPFGHRHTPYAQVLAEQDPPRLTLGVHVDRG